MSQKGGQADGTVIPLALQEKRGGAAQGGLIPCEQLAIDGIVRPPALQEKRVAAQEAVQEVGLFPREQLTQINGTVCTPVLQEEGGAAQEAAQEGGLLLHCSDAHERRGGVVQGGLITREQLAIDGTVRPPALQEKRVAAQEAAQEVGLLPREQLT